MLAGSEKGQREKWMVNLQRQGGRPEEEEEEEEVEGATQAWWYGFLNVT